MTDGIFVGLSTIDLIHSVDEFPPEDTKAVALSQEVLVGGPAANAAIAFSHLGGKATLVSAVGKHPIALLVKEELRTICCRTRRHDSQIRRAASDLFGVGEPAGPAKRRFGEHDSLQHPASAD